MRPRVEKVIAGVSHGEILQREVLVSESKTQGCGRRISERKLSVGVAEVYVHGDFIILSSCRSFSGDKEDCIISAVADWALGFIFAELLISELDCHLVTKVSRTLQMTWILIWHIPPKRVSPVECHRQKTWQVGNS
jgi:hypothetical protein